MKTYMAFITPENRSLTGFLCIKKLRPTMTVKTIKSVEELFESILLTHVQWLFVFNKTN